MDFKMSERLQGERHGSMMLDVFMGECLVRAATGNKQTLSKLWVPRPAGAHLG
jgi:hypothetical protein